MAADVSVEALEKVKDSAQQFGESVAKISADIVSQNETAMDDCKNAIIDAKKDLDAVIKTIQALDQQIYAKASEISHANNEIANLKNQIASFQSKLAAIESRIAMLENQRAQLQAQLSDTDDEERKKQIQQQINEVQRAISNCHAEESELRGKVSTAKYQIEELQSKISSLKAEMAKLEQERDREKVRKDKMADKLERMSRSFSTLSADLNEYTNAVKKFESKSASNVDANVSAIDKCITAIESYLAVNLAISFDSSSVSSSNFGASSESTGNDAQADDYVIKFGNVFSTSNVSFAQSGSTADEKYNELRNSYSDSNVVWSEVPPSQIALSTQGSGHYSGIDNFEDCVVREGTVLYRGEPNGTGYFTTPAAVNRSAGHARVLFHGVQVRRDPRRGYRSAVRGYRFNQSVACAYGVTIANPQFGLGGEAQFFVPDVDRLIRVGILTPIETIELDLI